MPHVNSGGGDDLASTDEVKVYKDEGEDEKRSSEHLDEDKLGLVTETEEGKSSPIDGQRYSEKEGRGGGGPQDGKHPDHPLPDRPGPIPGYVVTPYPYPNGATIPGLPGGGLGPHHPGALASLMMYNNDHFSQPPPAHMGIPPVHIDPKTGLPRPPVYIPPPPGQFPPQLYPEFSQMQWQPSAGYPITASGFRGQYPSSLVSSSLSRFSPPTLMPPHHPSLPPHPGLPHHAIVTPGPKQEIPPPHSQENHRHPLDHSPNRSGSAQNEIAKKKLPHIKKPLNAFMLFMKEMRAKVIAECTLKESAAINQILGRRWHALDRSEQSKYYDMARKEKELHMQLYPGWSARDNYATHTKKKKRKREPGENRAFLPAGPGAPPSQQSPCYFAECNNPKKCRARFGVDAQNQWCKPCRRKKKCIRFLHDGDGGASNTEGEDEDLSVHTYDSDMDSEPASPARSKHEDAPAILAPSAGSSSRMEDTMMMKQGRGMISSSAAVAAASSSSSSSSAAATVLNVPLPSSSALSSLAQSHHHHQAALSAAAGRQNSSNSPVPSSGSISNTLNASNTTATPIAT